MNIDKFLEQVASDLKSQSELNGRLTTSVIRTNGLLDKNIKAQRDLTKAIDNLGNKSSSTNNAPNKMTTDILNDINNNISAYGSILASNSKELIISQNKLFSLMKKPNKNSLGVRERFDPLSAGKEQRDEASFLQEKRSNELLEDILRTLQVKGLGPKEDKSFFGGASTLKVAASTFALGLAPAIIKSVMNSLGGIGKSLRPELVGPKQPSFLAKGMTKLKQSSFVLKMDEFAKSLPMVEKLIGAFSKTGTIGKGISMAMAPLRIIAKAPLLEIMAVYEGMLGLWKGDGIVEKLTLMGSGILGAITGLPTELANLIGGWFDIKWMKELKFGTKEWWVEQTQFLTHEFNRVITNISNTILSKDYWVDEIIGPMVDSFSDLVWEVTEWIKAKGKSLLPDFITKNMGGPSENPNLERRRLREERVSARRAYQDANQAQVDKFYMENKTANGFKLGSVSSKYESGGRYDIVSSGTGDFGGKSYGKYQLSSNQGSTEKFLNQSGYVKDFSGLQVGTKEYDAKWKELAKTKEFNDAQDKFAQAKYHGGITKVTKDTFGIDLSKRGLAVQEMLLSTGIQYGEGTGLVGRALRDRKADEMSDEDIIKAVQDYKAANVQTNFKSSSPEVRASVSKRIENEKIDLLRLSKSNSLQPLPEPAKTVQLASAKTEGKSSDTKAAQAPVVIGKMGGDTNTTIITSGLSGQFPYSIANNMKYNFGVI